MNRPSDPGFEGMLVPGVGDLLDLLKASPTVLFSLVWRENDFVTTWLSPNFQAVTGYRPEDALGDKSWWRNNLHPDDRARSIAAQTGILQTGNLGLECRFRHGDGQYHWIHAEYRLRDDPMGEKVIVGSWTDITDRKEKEQRELEAEKRFQAITEATQNLVVLSDPEGLVEYSNQVSLDILGVDAVRMVGARMTDFCIDAEQPRRFTQVLGEKRALREFPMKLRRTDGQVIDVEINARMVSFAGRDMVVSEVVDVTERNRRDNWFRSAIEAMPNGFAIYDAEDRLVIWNFQYWEMYGGPKNALEKGGKFEDLLRRGIAIGHFKVDQDDRETWIANRLERHRNPGEPFIQELADGRSILISERRTPDGGLVGIRTDVTEQVRLAGALKQREARLRNAIESIDDAFAIYDAEDRLVACNETYRRHMSGDDGEEIVGLFFEDILRKAYASGAFPDAEGGEEQFIQDRLERHRNPGRPFEQRTRNGRMVRVALFKTQEGDTVVVRADVTDQRRLQNDLETSEARLRDAIESMDDGFVVFDAEDRLVVCNERFLEFYGVVRDLMVPGVRFEDLLRASIARGYVAEQDEDEQSYFDARMEAHRNPGTPFVHSLADGRIIRGMEFRTSDGGLVGIRSDITAQRQLEDALRDSEQRLLDAIESMDDGFILFDAEDRLVICNQRYRDFYEGLADLMVPGVSFEHLLRGGLERGFFHDAVGREEEYFRERMERHRNPTGAFVQVLGTDRILQVAEVRTANGGLVGVRADITELENLRKALEKSEARLRDAIESLDDGFVIFDEEDRLVMWNERYADFYSEVMDYAEVGRKFEDLLRYAVDNDFYPELKGREGEWIHDRMMLHTSAQGSNIQRLRDGRWIRVTERRMKSGGIAGSRVDVTELTTSKMALEASERRFRDFTEVASDWIWETDGESRISYISERFKAFLGPDAGDFAGKTLWDLLARYGNSDEQAKAVEQQRWRMENMTPFRNIQFRLHMSSGAEHFISINGKPVFDHEDRFVGYRGTGTDVTLPTQASNQLRQAIGEAEAANRAKSEFLASMSHELRTPLNAILGFSQLLRLRDAENLQPHSVEYLEFIQRSGQHLLELVNQVLDLARIESGTLDLELEAVSLCDMVWEAISLVGAMAVDHQVVIEVPTDKCGDPWVWVDRLRLKQILINLLSNAIKYNKPGGRIRFWGHRNVPGYMTMNIVDTGYGIPVEKQDQVFIEFARLGREALDKEGAGIGLAICKKLVESMDGHIGFESAEGEGTTFWIEMPLSEEQPPTVECEVVSENG